MYAAAAVLDDPDSSDPARAAAGAKLLAADAAIENATTAIQVLGGMGFTWDMLPNHLLKRALATEQDFGTRSEEHTSELQSLMRISYAVFCLQQKIHSTNQQLFTSPTYT